MENSIQILSGCTDLYVLLHVSRVVASVVVRGEALADHPVVGVGPGADVPRAQPQPGGRHGLLHRGPVEQHRTVAGEAAVQLVAGALKTKAVSDDQ